MRKLLHRPESCPCLVEVEKVGRVGLCRGRGGGRGERRRCWRVGAGALSLNTALYSIIGVRISLTTANNPTIASSINFAHLTVCRHCRIFFCSSLTLPVYLTISMSRGGRGGGRGRGGRGGFGGLSGNVPPMGLTFADLQNLSREATELYPVRASLCSDIDVSDVSIAC